MSFTSTVVRDSQIGDGVTRIFSYPFKIISESHLKVIVTGTDGTEYNLVLDTDYTVRDVGEKNGGTIALIDASQVWLDAEGDLITGFKITLKREVPLVQEADIRNNGDFYPEEHEEAFDYGMMVDQQQQDEIDGSFKLPESIDPADFDTKIPVAALGANKVLAVNPTGDGFTEGPTVGDIAGAADSAAQAAGSQAAAALSEANAATSEGNAASSAVNAEASADLAAAIVAASQWNDVVDITAADSPYALASTDNGKLFLVDSSAGPVVFNLPTISALDLTIPFSLAIKKETNDGNTISVNPSGGDEVDSQSTLPITDQNQGFTLIPDEDRTPDNWTTLGFSSASGNLNPSKIEGTGGKVVTDSADMITGSSDGMVANTGTVQFQNSAGTIAYMQLLSSQWRVGSQLSQLRWPMGSTSIVTDGIFTGAKTRVNMASSGRAIDLPGNSYQGYLGWIMKEGGDPFRIQGSLGASIIGYPNGIDIVNDGEVYGVWQVAIDKYFVIAMNKIEEDPKEIFTDDFAFDISGWTLTAPTGSNIGASPGPVLTAALTRNDVNPLTGAASLEMVTPDFNFWPVTGTNEDDSRTFAEKTFSLDGDIQIGQRIKLQMDMFIDDMYQRGGGSYTHGYEVHAEVSETVSGTVLSREPIVEFLEQLTAPLDDDTYQKPLFIDLEFNALSSVPGYTVKLIARSQSWNSGDS